MMNNDNENKEEFEDIISENTDTAAEEPELEEIEAVGENKLKSLRTKLKQAEEDKRDALEELAIAKADFLNARKRLEEESARKVERTTIRHVEALLPLYDSFHMAMSNTEVWEKADENWRKGIEGIHSQLKQILDDHKVTAVIPTGEEFDPNTHDAIGTEPAAPDLVDKVISVMQHGFTMEVNGKTEHIRPARVTTGAPKETS